MDSTLVLAASSVEGAPGGGAGLSCGGAIRSGPGGIGITSIRSTIHILAKSSVKGGLGRFASSGRCAPDGASISGDTVYVSADSTLSGNPSQRSLGVVPTLAIGPTVSVGTGTIAVFGYSGAKVGSMVISYFSEKHEQFQLPGVGVPVLLGGTIHWFDTRALFNGQATIPILIPNAPLFKNLVLHFQSVGIDANRALS